MSKNSDRRWLVCAGGAALLAVGALAAGVARGSEPIDPTLPRTWVVGAPRGATSMARLNAARSGLSRHELPSSPRIRWRARVQGGIAHPLAVDASGAVIVASSISTVTELTPDGKTAWSRRTSAAAPVTAPVLTSDGTRVVLTQNGELVGFDGRGQRRFSVRLPVVTARVADPLPLEDGGLIVAAGRKVLQIDRRGNVEATTERDAEVAICLRRGSETLLISDRGEVSSWRPPAEPSALGSFSGRVLAAALHRDLLTAVVDDQKLVDLDLKTQVRVTRVDLPNGLAGSLALSNRGDVRVVSSDGFLLGFDRQGSETLRVALEPPVLLGDAGVGASTRASDAPPIVIDPKGRVGFVRPGLDAGVVDAAGNITAASGAACLDPIDIAPAGPSRMLLACRSGVVFLLDSGPKR